jgi:hypothetical protein
MDNEQVIRNGGGSPQARHIDCPICNDTQPDKECEICGAMVFKLYEQLYFNDDPKMICEDCRDKEELRADMEYERQREEI